MVVRHHARLPLLAHWELVPQAYMVPEEVVLTAAMSAWMSAVRAVSQVAQAQALVVVPAAGYQQEVLVEDDHEVPLELVDPPV